MSESSPSLTLKVENFVSSVIRFLWRYMRTVLILSLRPRTFNIRLAQSRRKRTIVPPMTFLILGCFFFSIIIDTYAEGWIVYFNWIWLDGEISQKINERGGDLFSLTSIVRSGLPTFLCFAIIAQILAWLLNKSRVRRPVTAASITYAFGIHTTAFAFACFLPIVSIYALNPETSDSVVSVLWQYGLAYIVLGSTILFAVIAFLSPILILIWAAKAAEARKTLKPLWARSIVALPIFLASIFLATELGSIPGRFTQGISPDPKVDYQVMQTPELQGRGPGDVSRSISAIFFNNKTNELAYIDASRALISITIINPDGEEIPFKGETKIIVRDEQKTVRRFLPIHPGKSALVHFEVLWELDEPLGEPTVNKHDGSWSYSGYNVKVVYDPLSGAELKAKIDYNFNFLDVVPLP